MFSEIFRMREENSSISSLKEEFAQRIADAEKKVQLACKERDTAKKVISWLSELYSSSSYNGILDLLNSHNIGRKKNYRHHHEVAGSLNLT